MKISSKGRYALRLMLDIAQHNNGSPVRIKDISSRQEISDKYLEQIISILNKAGFVRSIRGPQGVVDHITLAELLEWSRAGGDNYCI